MRKRFCQISQALVSPIVKEFPFFVLFIFIFGAELIGVPVSLYYHYDPIWAQGFLRQLGVLFLYAYLLSAIISYTGSKVLRISFYMLAVTLYAVNYFLIQNFGYRLNPNVLILLAETNRRESSEFIDAFLFSKGSLATYWNAAIRVVAIVAVEFAFNRYRLIKDTVFRKWLPAVALPIVLLLIWGIISFGPIVSICRHTTTNRFFHQQEMELYKPDDPVSTFILSAYALYLVGHEMKAAVETTKHLRSVTPICSSDSLNVVLIIGESFNKWHSEVYGYGLHTTPCLRREMQNGYLFAFNDAVSPFGITSSSMKNLLSCNSLADDESWPDHPYFPAIFKAAGYSVYFWDNQKTFNPNESYTISLNSYLYDKDIARMSYTETNDSSFMYDDELVCSFEQSDKALSSHNLVIFHLMGQHFSASERYPPKRPGNGMFNHFTADSIRRKESYLRDPEKRQRIAEYDNAVLYNDYVIGHVINIFRDQSSVIVFLSDHGEETYDYKDAMYRHYERMDEGWARHIHNVPFMVWCSDKYVKTHAETVKAIRDATERPFMTDNLCQLMFHIGEICTDYYIPERDIISNQFVPRKRMIEDIRFKQYDYDEIRR